MQKNVGQSVVGNDEPIAFCNIEPLYGSSDLEYLETGLFQAFRFALRQRYRRPETPEVA